MCGRYEDFPPRPPHPADHSTRPPARGGVVNYYNEIDPFAVAWLKNLIAEKLIPAGVVDERSVVDVQLFIGSSPSANLQRALENKLRVCLAGNGWPEYDLTWSEWDMPSGPPIC